jgi:3',5'-cyclic AMP phosphodiesterase CpdA
MRIAVLSDVHGNLPALDAVTADIAERDADVVVNLGDLLSGAVQPRETADRLMDLDLPTVAGNHERQLLTLSPDRMSVSDRLAHDTLTDRHREWLAGLPLTLQPAEGVLAFHGSPPTTWSTSSRASARMAHAPPPRTRWSGGWGRPRTCRCCCAGTPICSGRCASRPARWS